MEKPFLDQDKSLAAKASLKKIRGDYLPKDTRPAIFREHQAPSKHTPRAASAAVGDQASWDTLKAEAKKLGVKAAERAAAQAVASLLGMDNPDSGADSEADEAQDSMTAGNATTVVGAGFESSAHWREMEASVANLKKEATETKEWHKSKDKSDEGRDAKVSALAGELATLAANEKRHFDKLESFRTTRALAPRPPFTPNPNGRCRKLMQGERTRVP